MAARQWNEQTGSDTLCKFLIIFCLSDDHISEKQGIILKLKQMIESKCAEVENILEERNESKGLFQQRS